MANENAAVKEGGGMGVDAARRALEEAAAPLQLKLRNGKGQGRCLFDALSAAGMRGGHAAVRQLVCRCLRAIGGGLDAHVTGGRGKEFAAAMEQDGTWGSVLCVVALAQVVPALFVVLFRRGGILKKYAFGNVDSPRRYVVAQEGEIFFSCGDFYAEELCAIPTEKPPTVYMLPRRTEVRQGSQQHSQGEAPIKGVVEGPHGPAGLPLALEDGFQPGRTTILRPGEETVAAFEWWRRVETDPPPRVIAVRAPPGIPGHWATIPLVHGEKATIRRLWVSGEEVCHENDERMEELTTPTQRCTRELYAYLVCKKEHAVGARAVREAVEAWAKQAGAENPEVRGGFTRTSKWGYEVILTVRKDTAAAVLRRSGKRGTEGYYIVAREPAEAALLDHQVIWLTAEAASTVGTATEIADRVGAEGGVALDAAYDRLGVRVTAEYAPATRAILGDSARPERRPGWRVSGIPAEFRIADVRDLLLTRLNWLVESTNRVDAWKKTPAPSWWVRAKAAPSVLWFYHGNQIITIRRETTEDIRRPKDAGDEKPRGDQDGGRGGGKGARTGGGSGGGRGGKGVRDDASRGGGGGGRGRNGRGGGGGVKSSKVFDGRPQQQKATMAPTVTRGDAPESAMAIRQWDRPSQPREPSESFVMSYDTSDPRAHVPEAPPDMQPPQLLLCVPSGTPDRCKGCGGNFPQGDSRAGGYCDGCNSDAVAADVMMLREESQPDARKCSLERAAGSPQGNTEPLNFEDRMRAFEARIRQDADANAAKWAAWERQTAEREKKRTDSFDEKLRRLADRMEQLHSVSQESQERQTAALSGLESRFESRLTDAVSQIMAAVAASGTMTPTAAPLPPEPLISSALVVYQPADSAMDTGTRLTRCLYERTDTAGASKKGVDGDRASEDRVEIAQALRKSKKQALTQERREAPAGLGVRGAAEAITK
jgi:hypothetical protein